MSGRTNTERYAAHYAKELEDLEIQKALSIRDTLLYPEYARKWHEHFERVRIAGHYEYSFHKNKARKVEEWNGEGKGKGREILALEEEEEQEEEPAPGKRLQFVWTAKDKEKLAASVCEEDIRDNPAGALFFAGNTYIDFDGIRRLAVPNLNAVDLTGNDSDDAMEDDPDIEIVDPSDLKIPDNLSPRLIPAKERQPVILFNDSGDDDDNDDNLNEIEVLPNGKDHIEPPIGPLSPILPAAQLPRSPIQARMSKRRVIVALPKDRESKSSPSFSSSSDSESDTRKKPKKVSKKKYFDSDQEEAEEEYFVDKGPKVDKAKVPPPKKIPRGTLPTHTLADFELHDATGSILSLLALNKKDTRKKRRKEPNSTDTFLVKKFVITGTIVAKDYHSMNSRITLSSEDFELERCQVAFDPITFFLFAKTCSYKIVSASSKYQPRLLEDLKEDFKSERDFLAPELYQLLPREMWSYFRTDPDLDLEALRIQADEDNDFVLNSFVLEPEMIQSQPLGEAISMCHPTEYKELNPSKKKVEKKQRGERKSIEVYLEAEIWSAERERIKLKAGDCVSVRAPANDIDHQVWFARIVYFYRSSAESELYAHLSYFTSATGTYLGLAAAGRRILFYSDNCDNCAVSAFVRPVEVTRILMDTNRPPKTGYYYAFSLEEGSRSFIDAEPLETISKVLDFCFIETLYDCVCCERKNHAIFEETPQLDQSYDLLQFKGVDYHLLDTICYARSQDEKLKNLKSQGPLHLGPLHLGRIKSFLKSPVTGAESMEVELILRNDQLFQSQYKDSRRVILTKVTKVISIARVVSHILIDHTDIFCGDIDLSNYNNDPNAKWPSALHNKKQKLMEQTNWFWSNQELIDSNFFENRRRKSSLDKKIFPVPPNSTKLKILKSTDIKRCRLCEVKRQEFLDETEKIKGISAEDSRINSFEPYSGGGIFPAGLNQGCSNLSTKFGCDIHLHAVETSRLNTGSPNIHHSKTSDVNEAIYFGQTDISGLEIPSFENIQMISGGPPCQGFSSANLHQSRENPKCLEPFFLLSSVALLRPWYSVMENVRHIYAFKLPMETDVTLINLLALMYLSLGYQFVDMIITSQSFGGPSKRTRYFSIAYLRGQSAPIIPEATHFIPKGIHYTLPTRFSNTTRARKIIHQKSELHAMIPSGEIFGDLKPYEIARPRINSREPPDQSRIEFNPQPWNSKGKAFGFISGTEYGGKIPQNTIQRALRLDNLGVQVLFDHFSKGFRRGEEAIMCTELGVKGEVKDGRIQTGNFEDVSLRYRPTLPPTIFAKHIPMFHARLQRQDLATPIRTTLDTQGYFHGPRYHPFQHRPISGREIARLQSIPDIFSLGPTDSRIDEKTKIAGNAVPVVLGAAIGKSINGMVRALLLTEGGFERTRIQAKKFLFESGFARARFAAEVVGSLTDTEDEKEDEMDIDLGRSDNSRVGSPELEIPRMDVGW